MKVRGSCFFVLVDSVLAAFLHLSFYCISRILGALVVLRTSMAFGGVMRTPMALMRTLLAYFVLMLVGCISPCLL